MFLWTKSTFEHRKPSELWVAIIYYAMNKKKLLEIYLEIVINTGIIYIYIIYTQAVYFQEFYYNFFIERFYSILTMFNDKWLFMIKL